MIGKAQAVRQPSIDELLASIRQAIHERVAPGAPGQSASAARAASPARPEIVAADAATVRRFDQVPRTGSDRMKPTVARSGGEEGFAGLLGGDVRLEEALARLNQTALQRDGDAPCAPKPPSDAGGAVAALPAKPKLRPSIDEWTRRDPAPRPASAVPERTVRKGKDGLEAMGPADDQAPVRPRPAERPIRTVPGARSEALLSSQAARAANSAFSRLTDTVASRSTGSERILDQMTRDCLRPLLKGWLDENLPGLVERLVREEIERIARPGR